MRRAISSLIVVLCATSLVAPTSAASATETGSCRVRNATSGDTYAADGGASLQRALDAATKSDTLTVRGRCVGTFVVQRDVSFEGVPTKRYPSPTLDADGRGAVLTLARDESEEGYGVRLTIRTVRITGGLATDRFGGAGIHVNPGTYAAISLRGRTSIARNSGAGIAAFESLTARLHNRARIARNAENGMAVSNAYVVMNDYTRIARNGNPSAWGGGILLLDSELVMRDHASIVGNRAEYGGGIANDSETSYLTMGGNARISSNSADYGGGVQTQCQLIAEVVGQAQISRNTARVQGGGVWGLGADEIANVVNNIPDDTYRPADDEECYLGP